jgi:hypothetical protein
MATVQILRIGFRVLKIQMKKHMTEKGFEQCKKTYPFTRHVQERNDLGFDSFVKNLMNEQEYNEYLSYVRKTKENLQFPNL